MKEYKISRRKKKQRLKMTEISKIIKTRKIKD